MDSFARINLNWTQQRCKDGLVVTAAPVSLSNAVLYLFALLYCFLGIAIVSDVFMRSIEKIVTATRKVNLKKLKRNRLEAEEMAGPNEGVEVRVWNPTVANLTLMALGSSAPEILLSTIEIIANNFRAGDLGPGTIVDKNTGVLMCYPSIPKLPICCLYFVTANFRKFHILLVISPNVVELWEALITFCFFVIFVVVAYLVDIKIWRRKKERLEDELQIDGYGDATSRALIEKEADIDACLKRLADVMAPEADSVVRRGPTEKPLTFCYATKNGVAKRDLHFLPKSETVQFRSGESVKEIHVDLVEHAKWRPNHVFYVHLRLVTLGRTSVASVRVPDDSASFAGEPMVQFVKNNYESEKYVRAFVTRLGRHDECTFSVRYETEAVTAIGDKDFKTINDGELVFVGSEYEKYIDVRIYDDMEDEKDETFKINLFSSTGTVTIGPHKRTTVTIISDDNALKNITNIRKLTSHYLRQMSYGADTWLGQLIEATSVNAGDIENATFMDCMMHIFSFPWKILGALVPPVSILGGWLSFFCALLLIGFITAVVGDLASIFGCMVGLKDAITAITLVALGTSLPDTFASKIAAESDTTADNAVGNVTGSNAVNVFLGLGLPWTIAAIYWATKDQVFVVNSGNLGFRFVVCSQSELGGPVGPKMLSFLILVLLWLAYVSLSVLQVYGYVHV
ncbi:unnamed protein product [Gongylonema pulchrum]|uniref:Calx-beta domain-containing protein n=1 Tax=Gongylonema pulchrum TaxID=637853 RepID=A0A183DSJ5_9BILA|nr:unnamed protein product [Gongylonema pulchrum]